MKGEYETICETCAFFWTAETFLPILQQQLEDTERKDQVGRVWVFKKLIAKLEGGADMQRPHDLTGLTM